VALLKVLPVLSMKAYGRRVLVFLFLNLDAGLVIGHLQASAALPPEKLSPSAR
jgi:hypothetical protein